jgi:hypothetical protein
MIPLRFSGLQKVCTAIYSNTTLFIFLGISGLGFVQSSPQIVYISRGDGHDRSAWVFEGSIDSHVLSMDTVVPLWVPGINLPTYLHSMRHRS